MKRRAIVAGAAAFSVQLGWRRVRAQDVTLRLASAPFDNGGQVFYAQEMGFFKKAGLDNISLQSFNSGAAMATAVASGAIDIANSNIVSLAQAYQKRIPFTIVAPSGLYSSSAPTSVLMVAKNSPFKNAADLNGKTIGANGLGGISQYAPAAWIDRQGGDSTTVKFVEMPLPDIVAALPQGRIDAGLVIEPYIAAAKADSRVIGNCFDAVAPTFLISGYFSMLDWAKTHVETVKRFEAAIHETAIWANKNHSRTAEILVKIANVKPEVVQRMIRIVYAEQSKPAQIQPVIDVTAKYGGISSFPAQDLIFRS